MAKFGPGVSEEVKAPVNVIFPHVTATCHCTTSSKQEDAEALFICPILCPLHPATHCLPKPRYEHIPVCSLLLCDSLLLKDFSANHLCWLYRGLAPSGTAERFQEGVWFLWLHLTVITAGFGICSHFSSTVLFFSEQYHFF